MDPFSLIIAGGAMLGLVQVARHSPREEVLYWMDAALFALLGALIGSRLYFVFLNFDYFRSRPVEIPQIWLGGLDWPGALLGGLLGILAIAFIRYLPLGETADRLAHAVPPLAIAAWLGCWAGRCGYGFETATFGLPVLSEDGSLASRFPVQMLAAFSLLCYYAWLETRVSRPLVPGRRAAFIGLGLGVNLLLFSFLRADPTPLWSGLRPDSWAAAAWTVLMLASSLLPGLAKKGIPATSHTDFKLERMDL